MLNLTKQQKERIDSELRSDWGLSKYQGEDRFELHDSNFPFLMYNIETKEYFVVNKKEDYPVDILWKVRRASETEASLLVKRMCS